MTYRASKYRIMSILLVFAMTIGAFTGFSYISAGEEQVTILYEEESKRTENEKHYLCSDGSYVALSYPGAVHYKAEDGSYQEIENALVYDEKTGTYQNPGNPDFSVSLATTENTDAVSVKAKELEEISFSTALLINGNGNSPKPQKKNIKAFNNMAKNAAGKNAKNPTVFDLPQVSSSLEYAKYYGDQPVVTGKYTLGGNALKEDIILTVPTDVTGLVTTYKVKNMTLTVNPDGSLLFKTADGKDAYTVNAPYMYDAEGSRCPSIAVSAVQKGNKFEVTYLPDSAWLTSAERVYPLTFDPTITTTSFAFSCDDRYYAGGVAYDSQELRVGYSFTGQSNFWYTYFKPLSYPEINQDYYTVTTVLMSFSMLTVAGSSPYANVYKLNSGADPADLNISEDGTYMGYMEMWEGNRGDFSLGTSYYTDNTLSEYVLWPQNTTTSYGYCYFGSMEHTTNRPMMRISYRPKALEGKFVLKNGTNYLLSNGGSATAPALQFKSAFDESDFYYCEWTFGYNETKRAYTISPAYDPQLCLQANSDNTATLVVAPATLTNNHFWYIDTDADESYLKIKSVGQSGNNLCITNNMALHSPSEDSTMFNWQVVESYQGVYTFKNVGQNKYLYTNNGLTYENTNIVLADKSAIASHKVDPFAFRLAYDTESMGYCIFPIASSNGTYRKITVNKTASSGSYSVKMKLASESVYSTFDLEAVTYSGELLQCAFTVKDAPTLALTGTPTVVTAPTSENGNVTTTDVVAQTYSETNANQQWILEPYMHTVHSNTTYTDAEKYYSSLDFRSPFDSNNPIVVTSDFGNRYRNSKVQTHEGVDMRARSPIDLYAPSSGRVAFVRSTVASTAGLYIVIETDYYAFDSTQKIYIVYMHMDSISVSVGDRVDQLSKVGQSGNTTTSDEKNYHLHCGIFVAQAGLTNFYSLTHQTSLWNITPINPLHFYEPESYVMSTSANDPLLRYIPTHS